MTTETVSLTMPADRRTRMFQLNTYIENEQERALRLIAEGRNTPLARIVREAIARYIAAPDNALFLVGDGEKIIMSDDINTERDA